MSTMGGNFTGGSVCPKCNGWMNAGASHQCPMKAPVPVAPQRNPQPSLDERCAVALERIAAVLEAIVAAPPPPAPTFAPQPGALDVEKTRATFAPKPSQRPQPTVHEMGSKPPWE